MNYNSPVYPTQKTFLKSLELEGSNNIITALPENRFEYQDLYDAYALSNNELGLLLGEYNYFYKIPLPMLQYHFYENVDDKINNY